MRTTESKKKKRVQHFFCRLPLRAGMSRGMSLVLMQGQNKGVTARPSYVNGNLWGNSVGAGTSVPIGSTVISGLKSRAPTTTNINLSSSLLKRNSLKGGQKFLQTAKSSIYSLQVSTVQTPTLLPLTSPMVLVSGAILRTRKSIGQQWVPGAPFLTPRKSKMQKSTSLTVQMPFSRLNKLSLNI